MNHCSSSIIRKALGKSIIAVTASSFRSLVLIAIVPTEKILMHCYPKLINDIYMSDEYYGENVLHTAIINEDPSMVKFLSDSGVSFRTRDLLANKQYYLYYVPTITSRHYRHGNRLNQQTSALNIAVFGDKDDHLELMDGVLIDSLKAKWNTFVKFKF
ncbi:hypothetical protein Zmor_002635 [Zophobas morio]|uniref:Uncharacterized protein n=1 Tax=Zophobas morio TaxID=2755281 RepID=A0AA38HJZ7_9CUCU|nr:hypothetical protein Zmor_002635 [Zophobas morio]